MDRFKLLPKSGIEKLPRTPGVYLFSQKKQILYIGKAISIKSRVKNHFNQPNYKDKLFIHLTDKVGFFETGSEIDALILEANLIKKYQPKYNVMWKDDKNYFYVAINYNKQGIPYVYITHQPRTTLYPKPYPLNPIYIGPFVEGTALKKTLRFLRKVFPYYTAILRRGSGQAHPKNKCTYCHLDLCPGPSPDLAEYKKNIKKLILILKGKRGAALKSLRREMKEASKNQDFEKAGKIRDQIYALRQIMAHARVIENNSAKASLTPDVGETLAKIIGGEKPISKIECYDVSNFQGKQATGSMAVFINGKQDKSQYKKFRIRMKNKPDDIAMLKEIISRRLNHSGWGYPDAMLIDGGKAQLNAAVACKSQFSVSNFQSNPKSQISQIKIISIAKGRNELFIENRKKPIPLKSLPQDVYNLIVRLDDEAHRFAINYHKKLRKKNLVG